MRKHFKLLSAEQCKCINENHVMWADFLSHFAEIELDMTLQHDVNANPQISAISREAFSDNLANEINLE